MTSNRAVGEWLSLFDGPILGDSALDRLATASYQIVIEISNYRERLSPHRALKITAPPGWVIDPVNPWVNDLGNRQSWGRAIHS